MSDRAELDAARREAEAALPPGWRLDGHVDYESFRGPGFTLATYSMAAVGPDGTGVIAVGLSRPAAYRCLARRLRGELTESDCWAPPSPPVEPPRPRRGLFR